MFKYLANRRKLFDPSYRSIRLEILAFLIFFGTAVAIYNTPLEHRHFNMMMTYSILLMLLPGTSYHAFSRADEAHGWQRFLTHPLFFIVIILGTIFTSLGLAINNQLVVLYPILALCLYLKFVLCNYHAEHLKYHSLHEHGVTNAEHEAHKAKISKKSELKDLAIEFVVLLIMNVLYVFLEQFLVSQINASNHVWIELAIASIESVVLTIVAFCLEYNHA